MLLMYLCRSLIGDMKRGHRVTSMYQEGAIWCLRHGTSMLYIYPWDMYVNPRERTVAVPCVVYFNMQLGHLTAFVPLFFVPSVTV